MHNTIESSRERIEQVLKLKPLNHEFVNDSIRNIVSDCMQIDVEEPTKKRRTPQKFKAVRNSPQ